MRNKGKEDPHVKYLGAEEAQKFIMTPMGAKLYQGTNQMWDGMKGTLSKEGKVFDTEDHSTVVSGKGWAIFVVSPAGVCYSESHVEGEFHHSSFLSGGAVQAAGEWKVEDGKLAKINSKSGHYRPIPEHLLWAVRQLKARGVDLSGAEVGDFERDDNGKVKLDGGGKPTPVWYPAEQYAENGGAKKPSAASAPAASPPALGSQQSPSEPSVSAERKAELLEKAEKQGWVLEENGTWAQESSARAYVEEDALIQEMLKGS
ncbi:MAG TPA: hypothetical protein VGG09_15075 [Acidimicrobiales bacterium]|jgi:hypothetical protein